MARQHVQVLYGGRIQGVGFRLTVKLLARGFEVTGQVRNLPDGGVELNAEGEADELVAFQHAIRDSELGHFIRQENAVSSEAKNQYTGFEIVR